MEFIYEFDYSVLNWIYENLHTAFWDGFFTFITHLADAGWFWIATALACLCFKRTRKIGCCMAVAIAGGALVGNVALKPLIARIRPYDICDPNDPTRLNLYYHLSRSVELLIEAPHDYSFPSGHTLASFEGAGAIFFCNKKWGSAALLLAALIAFSRLYLYVHYPTDVLVGALIGLGLAYGGYKLVSFLEKKYIAKKA